MQTFNVTTFQKLRSYFWDVQIDYRESEINGDLIVFLVKGKYQLCTANAIYSFEDRYDNFANIFKDHFDFQKLDGNRVLILGLGLGSVPIILDQIKPNHWDFTAVEIDEQVCELAAEYGYSKILSPLQTIIGDAMNFVASTDELFDLICVDIFIDDVNPIESLQLEFLRNLRSRLSPNGVVISNTLAFTEEHRIKSEAFFEEKFKVIFPDAVSIHTHLNNMLISDEFFV